MTLDFSPLFRSAIGFDRLQHLLDNVPDGNATAYPPYNIEKLGAEDYRLTMAVAGFRAEDLDMTVKDNTLVITGRVTDSAIKGDMLYRGIAARAFERRFVLADHMVVDGASIENGLLHVALKRVIPEALKPRKIAIAAATPAATHTIEQEKMAA